MTPFSSILLRVFGVKAAGKDDGRDLELVAQIDDFAVRRIRQRQVHQGEIGLADRQVEAALGFLVAAGNHDLVTADFMQFFDDRLFEKRCVFNQEGSLHGACLFLQ